MLNFHLCTQLSSGARVLSFGLNLHLVTVKAGVMCRCPGSSEPLLVVNLISIKIKPQGYKTFFMLNSAEHKICLIYHANKC